MAGLEKLQRRHRERADHSGWNSERSNGQERVQFHDDAR